MTKLIYGPHCSYYQMMTLTSYFHVHIEVRSQSNVETSGRDPHTTLGVF